MKAKGDGESGRVRKGICAVFGNIDDWHDRIMPGAFRKTISEGRQRAKHLWNHDFSTPPIAKIVELKELSRDELPDEVLDFAPEATGGLMVAREYYKNDLSNWILEAIDAGDIDEMSFGYDVLADTISEENDCKIRNLVELRLYDTSDVLWGMNPATLGAGAKNFYGMPLGAIVQQLTGYVEDLKTGRRNALNDENLIDAIHQAAVDLGATKCLGVAEEQKQQEIADGEEAEAAQKSTSLDLLQLKSQRLIFESAITTGL